MSSTIGYTWVLPVIDVGDVLHSMVLLGPWAARRSGHAGFCRGRDQVPIMRAVRSLVRRMRRARSKPASGCRASGSGRWKVGKQTSVRCASAIIGILGVVLQIGKSGVNTAQLAVCDRSAIE